MIFSFKIKIVNRNLYKCHITFIITRVGHCPDTRIIVLLAREKFKCDGYILFNMLPKTTE